MAATKETTIIDELNLRAREIWLTGLGMASFIEEEGTKLYKTVVEKRDELSKKGETLEKKGKEKIDSITDFFTEKKKDIPEPKSFLGDKLNSAFEVIGVSSHKEVKELSKKVDKLAANIAIISEKLSKKTAVTKTKA